MSFTPDTKLNRIAALAVVAGVATGLLVALMNQAIVTTERLVFGVDHLTNLDPTSNVSPTRLAVSLVVLGFVVTPIWFCLDRQEPISVPAAIAGKHLPVLRTFISAFAQAISTAAGAPVGRENAPRLVGALSASWVTKVLHVEADGRRIIIASAAGAGLAASFHLPLAGAIFTLELLLVEMSARAVVAAMLCSATAVATCGLFVPAHPIFETIPLAEGSIKAAIIIGLLAGLAGHAFGKAARWAVETRCRGRWMWLAIPAAFGLTAFLSLYFHEVSASGRWAAETVFTSGFTGTPIYVLAFLGLTRAFTLLACFKAGTVGGTLTPAFSMGAIVGAIFTPVVHLVQPDIPLGAVAILGAAAFLSTTMAAPMFSMIAAVEFTDMEPQGYLPMFIAVCTAALAVRLWGILVNRDQRMAPFTSGTWQGA